MGADWNQLFISGGDTQHPRYRPSFVLLRGSEVPCPGSCPDPAPSRSCQSKERRQVPRLHAT